MSVATYSAEVSQLVKDLGVRLKVERIWPSSIFLPDDPADIPLGDHFGETDKYDLLPAAFSIVEQELGIKLDAEFWDGLPRLTYAQAVEMMIKKKAEPTSAGDVANTSLLYPPVFSASSTVLISSGVNP